MLAKIPMFWSALFGQLLQCSKALDIAAPRPAGFTTA
jgi:hypothetical protein